MKKNVAVWVGVVVVVAIVIGVLLSQHKAGNAGSVTFGVITGLTGQYAFVGENYLHGAELAQEDWNAAHPNDQIQTVVEDDGFDPQKGLAAYQKEVGIDKVSAIMNMTSPTIDAIYSQVTALGIPVAQGGEQGIAPADDNVFQLMAGNIPTEIALGQKVKADGHTNVAVVLSNNSTLLRFFDGFKQGYDGNATVYKIDPSQTDLNATALKIMAQKPDAIVFLTIPQNGALAINALRHISTNHAPFYFDADVQSGFPDYQKGLGDANILNGSTVVELVQKYAPQFAAEYTKKFGVAPGAGSDWAYDSFMLLAQTRASDNKTWIQNIKNAKLDGVGGPIQFDNVGVRKPSFFIGTIKNGALPTQ